MGRHARLANQVDGRIELDDGLIEPTLGLVLLRGRQQLTDGTLLERPILPPGEPDSRHDGRENQDDRYTRPRPADPLPLPESPPASGHGYTRQIRDLKQAIAEPATYLAAGCQARDLDRTAAFWTGERPIHAAILRRFLIRMKLRRGVGAETSRISGLTRSLQSVASDGHHQSGRADM